jgi:pyridoxamine 5'-phosphate oxidase
MVREWIEVLRAALDDEFGDAQPRVCTLATVDDDGEPVARMVVCRRIDEVGRLYFVSDARSEKNAHLRRLPVAAVVFWLPRRREQIRLRGAFVEILDSLDNPPVRQRMWRELSPASRALFAWPQPGADRVADESAFPRELGDDAAVPPTFEVIILNPNEVDILDLKPHPHERTRWEGVTKRRLNP